jgi:hypothetical protein
MAAAKLVKEMVKEMVREILASQRTPTTERPMPGRQAECRKKYGAKRQAAS